MKKVKDTKYPTIKQMSLMSENLRSKFKTHSDIQISTPTYEHGGKVEYYIYVANRVSKYLHSWQELLSSYHKLMEDEV